MHRLSLLGLNHTTAPLTVREQLAFNSAQQREALARFIEQNPGGEAVLISTCNRVELYAAAAESAADASVARRFLATFHGVPESLVAEHAYEKRERAVVEHLFHVAGSLDSMVVGETQILGQVRSAYELAQSLGTTGTLLNPLFQRALAAGKEVMTRTGLGAGRRSVAGVAVDYARGVFERFDDKTVLSIGAGKMASLVLQGFVNLKPKRLLICNRDPAKAEQLARQHGGEVVPFESLPNALAAADVVLSGTGSAKPILTAATFDGALRQRRYRPIFVIDLAVPRDVEASVGQMEHVYLYNVDDLQQIVGRTGGPSPESLGAARETIARHVEAFVVWHRTRVMGPTIDRLYQRSHDLAREELERTIAKLPNISPAERQHLEELARRIVNKLLHGPVQTIRNAETSHLPAGGYVHAMEKLFGLEEGRPDTSSPPTADRPPPTA